MGKVAKFFLYAALASPLLVNRGLFFPFITGKALFFRLAVELAFLSYFVYLARQPVINWRSVKERVTQPLFLAIIFFTILFVITSLTAINPQLAFWSNYERSEGGWQIIHYFLFFSLTALLFNSKKDWINIGRWQLMISLLISLYALAQFFQIAENFIVMPGPVSGTLGNSSYLAIYLIFSLFYLSWLFIEEKNRIFRWLSMPLAALFLFLIYETTTQASYIALASGLIIAILSYFWQFYKNYKSNEGRFSKKTFTIGLTATIVTILLIGGGTGLIVFATKGGQIIEALSPRFWTWGSAFSGFLEKPILGWGIENFPYVFDKYYNPNHYGIESWFDRSHNIFFEYLISGGIVLLLAYLSMFCFYCYQLWKLKRDWFWPILLALPAIYLINGLTLFEVLPIYLNLFLFFAFFINYALGFEQLPPPRRVIETKKANLLARWLSIYIITGFVAASFYFTIYLPLQKNRLLIEAVKTDGKTPQEVFDNFSQALNFYSPVGQAELDQQLFNFSVNFIAWLEKEKILTEDNKKSLEMLAAVNLDRFKKDRDSFAGVKNSYLLLEGLLDVYKSTENQELLAQAESILKKEIKLAPARIEFLKQQLKIAELKKDEEAAKKIRNFIKKLRPDLEI